MRNDALAYLLRLELLILFEAVSQQRFIDTDGAMRGVVILEASVKTLVAKPFIAMAVTRKLGNGPRNLFHCLVRRLLLAEKLFRRKRRPEVLQLAASV